MKFLYNQRKQLPFFKWPANAAQGNRIQIMSELR